MPSCPTRKWAVEWKHRHIVDMRCTLLHHASLPSKFWNYAFEIAVYFINQLLTKSLQFRTTFHLVYNQTPDYMILRVFGCLCFPYLHPYATDKLSPHSRPCLFLGYPSNYHGYRCLDPTIGRIFISP